jgi:hypothetical protein
MKLPAKYASISGDLKGVHAGALAEVLDKAVDKMNNVWKAERDPEKFFKLIIAEKQEGKEMMDGCKEVLAFYQNQMPLFSEIYSFTEDNKDNFDFITEADDKKLVEELKEIITDKRPDQNLPKYKKRRDILRGKLADIKKDLVKKIEDAYSKVLDELEAFAKASGVSFDRDHFRNITVPLTTTNNFYALQSNANTDSFKQEQIDAIIKQTSTPGAPVKRVHIHINQVFKAKNIHNEAEIDAYVAEIKNKLIEKLADNDELIVS